MPEPKGASSGGLNYGPKKERKLARRYINKINKGGDLSLANLEKTLAVVKRSKAQGTFNKKDANIVKRMVDAFQTDYDNKVPSRKGNQAWSQNYYDTAAAIGRQANNFVKPGTGYSAVDPIGKPGGPVGGHGPVTGGKGNAALKPHPKGGGSNNRPGTKFGPKGGGGGSEYGTGSSVGDMYYQGLGAPPKTSRTEAQATVQQEINLQVKALMDQIAKQKNAKQYDVEKIKALYNRTAGDLDYVFGEANDYIGSQNRKIDRQYGATTQGVQDDYAQYRQQAAQQVAANRGNAMSELERLGIQQSGLGRFDADAANTQGLAAANQQNVLANLGTMQQGTDEIGALLGSMSQASLASARGRAANTRQDQIGDTRQEYLEYFNDQLNSINSIKRQRPQMVNELYQAMQGNNFQQWMDMQQANFNNQLATNNFNLDVAGLNSDNTWKAAAQRLKAAEARWERKKQESLMEAGSLANQLTSSAGNIIDGLW